MGIFSWFGGSDSENAKTQEEPVIAPPTQVIFLLLYKNHEIGTLEFSSDQWVYSYSEWFKSQKVIKPFANFPDVTRQYFSFDLPPFFESRLPGASQPYVEDYIKKIKKDQGESEATLKAALLKQFGRRTISNPFELQPA